MDSYIAERFHGATGGTDFCYGVRQKSIGKLIGQVTVRHVNWKSQTAELGYLVDAQLQRQGIALQMMRHVVDELFEKHKFRRLTVRSVCSNEASTRLVEKLGFIRGGTLRREFLTGDGESMDGVLYSRLRTD